MKPLYTKKEFINAKSEDLLKLQCYHCKSSFNCKKKFINLQLKKHTSKSGIQYEFSCKYCNKTCKNKYQTEKNTEKVNCINCNKEFRKKNCEIKKHSNHFCTKSCAATYNNTHKTHGNRRSKLEVYLEKCLKNLYPNLAIDFNKKDTINSELDIYIPSLKLAIELNGIYHYEPIHGSEKLSQIQNNDQRKFQACLEKKIELLLIDVSKFTYFKPERADYFLDIITKIINQKLSIQ